MITSLRQRFAICSTLLLLTLSACSGSYRGDPPPTVVPPSAADAPFDVVLQLQDEQGTLIAGATVVAPNRSAQSDAEGRVTLSQLAGPTALVVYAPGHLNEPLVVDREQTSAPVTVRLWSNANGTRWSMHAGGDAMFGRRYLAPPSGNPLIGPTDPEGDAAAVVRHLQPLFAAADFRTLNLETSVSDLDESFAYQGKRFILNSPTATLAAIEALQVDLVVLANNHVRDYSDIGVTATLTALDQRGLTYQGAGIDAATATTPVIQTVNGTRIGTLSYTTVTGSFVNDNYPQADDPVPADLPDTERWQYEARPWQFNGATWHVPAANRRIGEAWALFAAAESDLPQNERDAAWASLEAVYPELQDWVARRGHGGAAFWLTRDGRAAIESLRSRCDLVVVQMHSGFQYQEVPSESLRRNARSAIDAGADIVICHHPHVLQSVEWYRDKLIAYSLGNFVFDQDFLVTFPSVMLRTVWDGTELLEAKLMPFEIQAYQPAVVSGAAARRTLRNVWEMNLNRAQSLRDAAGAVRATATTLDAQTVAAQLVRDGHQARITKEPVATNTLTLTIEPGQTITLPDNLLIQAQLGDNADEALDIGRDLFGWGRFEDEIADSAAAGGTHWNLDGTNRTVIAGEAYQGLRFLRIQTVSSESEARLTRPLARVPLPAHRLYQYNDDLSTTPLDPTADYSLRYVARRDGDAIVWNRFDLYQFTDTDPTEEPESTLLASLEIPVTVPDDGAWHRIEVPIAADALVTDTIRANALNFYAVLGPAQSARAELHVDDLTFIEWRQARGMPDRFGRFDFIRNRGTQTAVVTVTVLAL